MTSQPRIMGKLFTSSKPLQVVIWVLVAAILAINAYMIVSVTEGLFGNTWWLDVSFVVVGAGYYSFVLLCSRTAPFQKSVTDVNTLSSFCILIMLPVALNYANR